MKIARNHVLDPETAEQVNRMSRLEEFHQLRNEGHKDKNIRKYFDKLERKKRKRVPGRV